MDKNSDEAIKQNEYITKTSATIDTPTIKMSVETESTDKTGVQTSQKGCTVKTCCFYKMSIALFVASIVSIGLLFINVPYYEIKLFLGAFSIISLILSVVAKLKTDEEKCLRLLFVKSVIQWFDKKEISINDMKDLLECCEL